MKKITKILALSLCLAMVAMAFAACSNGNQSSSQQGSSSQQSSNGSSSQQTADVYKAAYMGPFTGNGAQYGERNKAAYLYALDEINAAGGVNGVKLEIDWYDDKNDAKEAVTVAQKISQNADYTICFGPFASACGISAAPVFAKVGLTLCSPSASHPDFCSQSDYMVTGSNTQETMQEFFCDFVYNDLGYRKVGQLLLQDDVGVSTAKLFKEKFEALGGEVTICEMFVKDTVDFSAQIVKVKNTNPDMFYAFGTYADVANIANQAKNLDFNVPIFSHDNMMVGEFLEVGGDALEGFLTMTQADPNLDVEKYQTFRKGYIEKTGNVVDGIALACYDQAYMWAEALKQFGPDRAKINDYMRNVKDFDGVSCVYSVENGNCKKPYFPVTVKDGESAWGGFCFAPFALFWKIMVTNTLQLFCNIHKNLLTLGIK